MGQNESGTRSDVAGGLAPGLRKTPPSPLAAIREELTRRRAGALVALALLYVVSARLGLELAQYYENVTLVWPPTGLSLAALVLFGRWLWPGVAAGALAATLASGEPSLATLGVYLGNAVEVCLGAYALERIGFRPNLARVRDVVTFLLVGVVGTTLVGSALSVTSLLVWGVVPAADFGVVWLLWWLGDAGGVLVLGPLLFIWFDGSPAWRALARSTEAWVVLSLLVVATTATFWGVLEPPWSRLATFLPILLLVWAGTRLGPRGAVTASFMTTLIAVTGNARGLGPFYLESTPASLLLIWAYGSLIASSALTLAAATAEREAAQAERLRLEQKMHQTQRLESLGLLAGGIAHDFNNILTAIGGFAELLGKDFDDASPQAEKVSQIRAGVSRAAELCERLLVYAGRTRSSPTAVSLLTLFGELETLVQVSVPKKVSVDVELPSDLPSVEGDPALLQQLFMNLVLNGAEAVGGDVGTVWVTGGTVDLGDAEIARMTGANKAAAGRFVYVDVRDSGSGMDRESLARIFDPFFTTKFTGRGLGLASALGIVQAHRGAIDVASTPGLGTTFRVYLPPLSEDVTPAEESRRRDEVPSRSARVLVADDEPSVAEAATLALERAGFRVEGARDGREAVECFRRSHDDLDAVLLDVTMPKLGGLEALAEIRAIDPDVPVILMSGYEAESAEGAVGSHGFIRKPFALGDLVERIQRAVARRPEVETAGAADDARDQRF